MENNIILTSYSEWIEFDFEDMVEYLDPEDPWNQINEIEAGKKLKVLYEGIIDIFKKLYKEKDMNDSIYERVRHTNDNLYEITEAVNEWLNQTTREEDIEYDFFTDHTEEVDIIIKDGYIRKNLVPCYNNNLPETSALFEINDKYFLIAQYNKLLSNKKVFCLYYVDDLFIK